MNLSLILTQQCNLLCQHCYLPSIRHQKSLNDEISFDKFELGLKIISNHFSKFINEIYVTGGEFILLSYGEKVIDRVRCHFPNSRIYAYTNGIFFKNNPKLIQNVQPDVYHVGIDLWHSNVDKSGNSLIADYFIKLIENRLIKNLIFHWTRKDNDSDVFDKFYDKYSTYKQVIIEDRSLNTTTGRAKQFPDPDYRDSEVWRSCDLGNHVLLKYDGYLYCCHYALPITSIGKIGEKDIGKNMNKIKSSILSSIYSDTNYQNFYRYICDKYSITWSKNRCLLCEKFMNYNIKLFKEADDFAKMTNLY